MQEAVLRGTRVLCVASGLRARRRDLRQQSGACHKTKGGLSVPCLEDEKQQVDLGVAKGRACQHRKASGAKRGAPRSQRTPAQT